MSRDSKSVIETMLGALKNAANIFIGCDTTFLKMLFTRLCSFDASSRTAPSIVSITDFESLLIIFGPKVRGDNSEYCVIRDNKFNARYSFSFLMASVI